MTTKEKRAVYAKKYYLKNRESILAKKRIYAKKYYAENKERLVKASKEWYQNNKEKVRARLWDSPTGKPNGEKYCETVMKSIEIFDDYHRG
jgi:hypothetical protein